MIFVQSLDTDTQHIMLFHYSTDLAELRQFEQQVIDTLEQADLLAIGGSHFIGDPTVTTPEELKQLDPYFKKYKAVKSLDEFKKYFADAEEHYQKELRKLV